ncbi:MAG: DUF3151 family protein [Sporichthyaceae bacterium]
MDGVGALAKLPCGRVTKWFVVLFWIAAVVVAAPLAGKLGEVQENEAVNWLPSSAESTRVYEISAQFQNPNEAPAVVVYERLSGITDADRALVASHVARFDAIEHVDAPVSGPFPSPDGQALQLVVPYDMGTTGNGWEELPFFVEELMAADVPGDGLLMYITGPAGFNGDLAEAFEGTEGALLLAALGVVVFILLMTYRSPVLWLLPAVSAVIALAVSLGAIYLLADNAGLTVNAQAQVILSILVFGASTDYALLLVARYREELRKFPDRHEAMAHALHRSGPAIVASGVTVLLGMLCLMFAEMNSTASLGPVLAIGIAVGLLVMLTFLPALLVIVGRWIFWPARPGHGMPEVLDRGLWAKVGRVLARRPRRVWIGTTLALGAMAFGLTQLSSDGLTYEESFPNTPPSIVGQQVLNSHFAAGAGDPLIVMARAEASEQVATVLRTVPGLVPESVVSSPPAGGLSYVEATLTDAPDGKAAKDTVERVRSALDVVGPDAIVGGSTAVLLDTATASARDNKVVIPITLVVVMVILIVLLRSLLAPLLLLATVLLSFAATLGIAAVTFEHAFGFAGTDSAFPLFAFVFLVALGIDYNIFLMTRVHEESRRIGTRQGALLGLSATGGVITSAGLVLAGTFAVMMAVPIVFLIEIGFVVAVGVLIDTFIVRSVLVTALTLDIGRRIWWPSSMSKADFVTLDQWGEPEPVVAASVVAPGQAAPLVAGSAQAAPLVVAPAPRPVAAPGAPVHASGGYVDVTAARLAPANGHSVGAPRRAADASPDPSAAQRRAAAAARAAQAGKMGPMNIGENLMAGPPATLLPELADAAYQLERGTDPTTVAGAFPEYSRAWAILADGAYAMGRVVESYAYARTGYHRGLDALRRNGWKGHGPVPWEHAPNQGFLRALHALGRAAAEVGESGEAERCATFLRECSPTAAEVLGASAPAAH